MKAKIEKQKGKLVMLEVGHECQKENLEEEVAKLKKLWDKLLHLQLDKRSSFQELKKSIFHEASVGSPQTTTMEGDIMV